MVSGYCAGLVPGDTIRTFPFGDSAALTATEDAYPSVARGVSLESLVADSACVVGHSPILFASVASPYSII